MKNIQQNESDDKTLKMIEEIASYQDRIIDDLKLLESSEISEQTLKDIEAIRNREVEIIEEIDLLIANRN